MPIIGSPAPNFNVTTYICLIESNKKWACLLEPASKASSLCHQDQRLTCGYVCAGRKSGAWDSKSTSLPAAPSPLPRAGWVPVAEKQLLWFKWLVSITAVSSLPGTHKGVLPEYLGAKAGQVSFCYFHPEEHTCPSSDAGTSNITITVLLECGNETLLPYSSPHPRHASSWTSGAPADIQN